MANERRLIDVNELWLNSITGTYPTVEIVRCKDCNHYAMWSDGRAMNHCSKHDRLAYDDDFCSYGELRCDTLNYKIF